jgi:hypothetical protein
MFFRPAAKVRATEVEVTITCPWFYPGPVALLVVALSFAIAAVLGPWELAPGATAADVDAAQELVPVFYAIAATFAYYALVLFVNSTTVMVARERIDVRHGPLP